jgi:TonB-linked SusC/RagA family outer membrane protein
VKASILVAALVLFLAAVPAAQPAWGQTGTIQGVVTDSSTTEALPGVNVAIRGSSQGAVTDDAGRFAIADVPPGTYVLDATFVGYDDGVRRGIAVRSGDTTRVRLSLAPKNLGLSEVVVVGYGTEERATLTGAVDDVEADALENRPITSTAEGLQGRVPNLNITFSDGQPGNREPEFNIRGTTSINGGSPLVLIDGVPGDPTLLNPNDIKSVTVLKDAASAAVYGGRAAFGVIQITTKDGSGQEDLQVGYSANVAASTPTILPDAVTDPYTSMRLQNEAYRGYSGVNYYSDEALEYAEARSEDPSMPAVVVEGEGANKTYNYYGSTDWFDELYRGSSQSTNHHVSVSGGGEGVDYYLSGSYLHEGGIFEYDADGFDRYTFRGKVSVDLEPWLTLRNNLTFNRGDYDYPAFNTFFDQGGLESVNDLLGAIAIVGRATAVPKNPDGTWTLSGSQIGFLQEGGRGLQRRTLLRNKVGIEADLVGEQLGLRANYAYQEDGFNTDELYRRVPYKGGSYFGGPTPANTDYAGVSRTREINANNFRHVFDAYLEYDDRFGPHSIDATVGVNQELRTRKQTTARKDQLVSSQLGTLNLAVGNSLLDERQSEWALRGVFYRLQYDYEGRYLLEFNGRYDGSSRFPEGERYGFFPSVSAGWRVTEEPFADGLAPVFSDVKLRASYGSLGNQQVSPYPYVPTMPAQRTNTIIGGERLVEVSAPGLVPQNLTWETVSTFDVGLDLAMFDGRLDLTADWYRRTTTDMLTKSKTLPAVLGAEEPRENAADLQTDGWELSIGWSDTHEALGRPFEYSVRGVLSDYKTTITRFDNPSGYLGDFYEGQTLGEIWGYKTLGFFQSEEGYRQHADQSDLVRFPDREGVGDVKLADRNGDGVVGPGAYTLEDHGDLSVIGNSRPRYRYGVNASVGLGGVEVSAFVQGIGERDFYPTNEAVYFWSVYNRYYNTPVQHLVGDTWTPDNRDAYFPRLKSYEALGSVSGDNAENPAGILAAPQTRYLQDASYVRLKTLTVAYTLPGRLVESVGADQLRIYFTGENLWEHTGLRMPTDPELLLTSDNGPAAGRPNGQKYPIQRSYSVGIDLRF